MCWARSPPHHIQPSRRAWGSIYILHLRMESSCHFPLHRDRGAWGEESCGSRRSQSTVPADFPGTKRTSEDHLSDATFATSGFIKTAKIFQTYFLIKLNMYGYVTSAVKFIFETSLLSYCGVIIVFMVFGLVVIMIFKSKILSTI